MLDGGYQQPVRDGSDTIAIRVKRIAVSDAPILIVDDQPESIQLLATILAIDGDHAVHTTTDPARAGRRRSR